jgi:ABC-type transporter Mla MlaB component
MPELQMLTSTYRSRLLITVIGPLNRRTAGDLRSHLRRVLTDDSELPIDLDLRCCIDLDIDGLLVLDTAENAARVRGRSLRLVQVPPLIERVLRKHHAHLLGDSKPEPNTHHGESDGGGIGLETPEADAVEQHLSVTDDEETDPEQDGAIPPPLAIVPLEADPADVAEQHQPVGRDDEHPNEEPTTPLWVGHHDR